MNRYGRRWVIWMTVALVVARAACNAHALLYCLWPGVQWDNMPLALWLDAGYRAQPGTAITAPYYIYELSNLLYAGVWRFCFALTALCVSRRLATVIFIFALHSVATMALYVYNRNSGAVSEIILYIALILPILGLFWPERRHGAERRQAKLINL